MAEFQDKERILEAAREKQEVTNKGAPIRLAADFSMETLQDRRERQGIFQVTKNKGLQPRLLYPEMLSIKMDSQTRSFPDKRHLKEYTPPPNLHCKNAKGTALRKGRKRVRERGTHVRRK